MPLKNKVAIVTGAGRGIGRAIALRFAAEGAQLVLAARTSAELESVAAEIKKLGGKEEILAVDLVREEDCMRVVSAARDSLGGLDILVNNAGIYGPVKPIEEITAQEWDEVMNVDLRSAFFMTKFALPELYKRGSGAIVNISSISAKAALGWGAAYASAKAGMLGLTRTTAAEAAWHGVRANAICPGPVPETEMSQELGRGLAARAGRDAGEMFKELLNGILQHRAQTTAEIADAALFLASDHSSAITGQVLNVDGGMLFA